jgi:hypothetical protein
LPTAAEPEHRSIANMAKVIIRDYFGRHGTTIREQSALFLKDDCKLQTPER